MNPLKSSLHRTAAVLTGALLGVTGAVVSAAPASAYQPVIQGDGGCVNSNGTWQIRWTVTNSEPDLEGDIVGVSSKPFTTSFSGIAIGDLLPMAGAGKLTGDQVIPKNIQVAIFEVTAHWTRDGQDVVKTEFVERPKPTTLPKCPKPTTPTPSPTTPSPTPTPSPTTPSPSPTPTTTSVSPSPTASPQPTGSSPAPVPGPGGLPLTGAAVGSIAAGAVLLLGIGAILFILARRRRVKFTP